MCASRPIVIPDSQAIDLYCDPLCGPKNGSPHGVEKDLMIYIYFCQSHRLHSATTSKEDHLVDKAIPPTYVPSLEYRYSEKQPSARL